MWPTSDALAAIAEDFAQARRQRPDVFASPNLRGLVDATEAALASVWVHDALAGAWTIASLFGYRADASRRSSHFGLVTAMGLGLIDRRLVFLEGDMAIAKWSTSWAGADPLEVAFAETLIKPGNVRLDRRTITPPDTPAWWRSNFVGH